MLVCLASFWLQTSCFLVITLGDVAGVVGVDWSGSSNSVKCQDAYNWLTRCIVDDWVSVTAGVNPVFYLSSFLRMIGLR